MSDRADDLVASSATTPPPAGSTDGGAPPGSGDQPWRDRYLVFGAPSIGAAERDELLACIDSGWLGSGPRVAELERRLAAYLGAPAVVAVSSCTAALHLALRVLDLPPGSE